jgi:hypothetical protein
MGDVGWSKSLSYTEIHTVASITLRNMTYETTLLKTPLQLAILEPQGECRRL